MEGWKDHGPNKSSDELYTHHDRLVIPRLAQDPCILLFTACHIMLAIKLATPVGNFVKRFLEGTSVSCWFENSFLQL